MIDTPQIVQHEKQLTAALRLTVPRAEIREVMGPGLKELRQAVADQGVVPSGPWFTHHFRMDPAVFDYEICLPVTMVIASAGRITPGEWPAMKLVQTVYTGGYDGLEAAWREFDDWIAANGLEITSDLYEVYLTARETTQDVKKWQTELSRRLVG